MRKLFFLFLLLAGVSKVMQAQITWNFTAATGTGAPTNSTSGSVTQNLNNGTTTFLASGAPLSSVYPGFSAGGNGNFSAKTTAFNLTTSTYLQAIVTPAAGYWLNITGIKWGNFSLATTGPTTLSVYFSNDNFVTSTLVATSTVVQSATAWTQLIPTITPYNGLTGTAVTIRIYASGGTGTTPAAAAVNWRVDDLAVTATVQNGTVGQIPKYSSGNTYTNSVITESNTNIGIGITTPTQKLDVAGGIKFTGALLPGGAGGTSGLFLQSTGPTTAPVWAAAVGGASGWGLTGNAGTNPYAVTNPNFIGTTDDNDLLFKRNGIFSGLINNSKANTSFGFSTIQSNTTGTSNTAMGWQAGQNNTTGSYNVYLGTSAGAQNLIGNYNSFVGNQAGFVTTSDNNTFTGFAAGISNTIGSSNTFTGMNSGFGTTTGIGNSYFGRSAGYYATTANNNTILGFGTGYGIISGSHNTILGANVVGLSPTLSNNIILADGAGNRRINVNELGNVGIGTTTPNYLLHVNGEVFVPNKTGAFKAGFYSSISETDGGYALVQGNNIKASPISLNKLVKSTSGQVAQYINMRYDRGIYFGTNVGAGDNPGTEYADDVNARMVIDLDGKVGIGTTSPRVKLDVGGDIIAGGQNSAYIKLGTSISNYPNITTNINPLLLGANNTTIMAVTADKIGIGTVTPTEVLDVVGNIRTNEKIIVNGGLTSKVLIGNMFDVNNVPLNIGDHKLVVNGSALFTKAVVRLTSTWPDYVFEPTNKLPTLSQVEAYVTKHKHLEGVPSAAEVKEKGIDLGDNQTILLKKVEELTLYMIELNKKVELLAKENEELKKKINGDNK